MMYHVCPVCGGISTLIYENGQYNCIACGYRATKASESFRMSGKLEQKPISFERDMRICSINETANAIFMNNLENNERAIKYAQKRGLSKDIIRKFGIGYADGKLHKKISEPDLKAAELANNGFEYFRDRLMFPIRDNLGRLVGFGGRTLGSDDIKYLNTKESELFKKHSVFYGIDHVDWKLDYLILCEGYMDVVSQYQSGIANAIASMGTALTENHVMLLKQTKKRVLCMYDSDAPGMEATYRNMSLLKKFGVNCGWVDLGKHKDPDEFVRAEGASALAQRIANPKTIEECFLKKTSGELKDCRKIAEILCKQLV